MTSPRSKWIALGLVLGVILTLLASLGAQSLLRGIDRGKLQASLRDAHGVVSLLHAHREEHQHYPLGFTADDLNKAIGANYRNGVPPGISYYSDGRNYALILRTNSGATPAEFLATIEIRNGRFLTWPDAFDAETIRAIEREYVRLHERVASPAQDPPAR